MGGARWLCFAYAAVQSWVVVHEVAIATSFTVAGLIPRFRG
jgi:hypothetical protein